MTNLHSVVVASLVFCGLMGCAQSDHTESARNPDAAAAEGGGSPNGGAMGTGVGGTNVVSGQGGSGGSGGAGPAPSSGGQDGSSGSASSTGGRAATDGGGHVPYVFVIAMENHDATSIIGNSADAGYINGTLLNEYASASNYIDPLPIAINSEPHYVWMEAGTNVFADHTFTDDSNPSSSNSTKSTQHLATQITQAGLTWRSYQESIDAAAGVCPIQGSADGFFAPKHDPFVFFQDVAGNPPSKTNPVCALHHEGMDHLSGDLLHGTVANYNFITPNLCNDMHGQGGCPNGNTIQAGDQWLAANLPPIISFANGHDGFIFIVWDEGESSNKIPFLAIGPGVVKKHVSTVEYGHSSLLKSVEEILRVDVLPTVRSANDFADLFRPGAFP